MTPVILLTLSAIFAFLAYDAWKLAVPGAHVPYEVNARPLGMEVDGVPLAELEKRKEWNLRHGLGDLRGAYWLWIIASIGCAGAAAWTLLA
jgi:hypothetical protein